MILSDIFDLINYYRKFFYSLVCMCYRSVTEHLIAIRVIWTCDTRVIEIKGIQTKRSHTKKKNRLKNLEPNFRLNPFYGTS